MAAAQVTVSGLPGLERLTQLATININQTSSGYYGSNYKVLSEGEVLFSLNEIVPDTIFRGGSRRSFIIDGVDNTGRKVFSFRRTLAWMSDKVELFMGDALVSVVQMETTFLTPILHINDPLSNFILRLKGKLANTASFELQTNTKLNIGGVYRKYRGWTSNLFSFNDDYTITFPADLAVQYKLAVIVACAFIDFRFHEGK